LCLADLEKRTDLIKKSPGETMPLEEMDPGQRGKILKIQEHSEIDDRLSGMGVSSGSIIEVEKQKSETDHIAVKVRGYHLSLRKTEAAKISVELYRS
jgi:Fe2+ transport system protein FeoA